jgi:hypothetical protein
MRLPEGGLAPLQKELIVGTHPIMAHQGKLPRVLLSQKMQEEGEVPPDVARNQKMLANMLVPVLA